MREGLHAFQSWKKLRPKKEKMVILLPHTDNLLTLLALLGPLSDTNFLLFLIHNALVHPASLPSRCLPS